MHYLVYIFIGGGLGSIARFGLINLIQRYNPYHLPWGTILTNLLACFLMAFFIIFLAKKTEPIPWMSSFLLIGFCGAFSTFSTFSFESVKLVQDGHVLFALANMLISVALGFAVVYFLLTREV